jgi:hypothetical protein
MTKVTDRLDNQNLINLARQQFEADKRKKLPSEIVNLASAGKIYPKDHVLRSGQVEMRYMTAYDEDILTNTSYIKNGVVFDKLLESIILTDVDVQEIAEADRFGLIIYARILAYGPDYAVIVTDPETGHTISRTINLRSLTHKPFDLEPTENGEFEYQVNSDTIIHFKYPTKEVQSLKVSEYLQTIITQVNDSREASVIDDFIRYGFLSQDAKPFRKFVTENEPGLNLNVTIEGETGSTFTSRFPVGPELFWF